MAYPDSPTDRAAAEFVAERLERLVGLPLDTPEDEKRWGSECAIFQTALATHFPTFELEHQVWHFFTDTDIRRKEAGYRQWQHEVVANYIIRLRYGNC